jgi:hypothetical protein
MTSARHLRKNKNGEKFETDSHMLIAHALPGVVKISAE